MFRIFSYRQVSLTGAIVVFISLLLTTFSYNFTTYLVSFSILYGAGYGISSSANALALNTYWKNRRRLATSLSWTTTGLGPMLWPQIITALFAAFGETGTTLFLAGFSLHAIACALILQPVEWHSKSPGSQDIENIISNKPNQKEVNEKKNDESGYFSQVSKLKSVFSSQYLYNEDDPINPGYEITDPGIPMMIRANDGYYSQSRSRVSSKDTSTRTSRMTSKKPSMSNLAENRSRKSSTFYLNESKTNSYANLGGLNQERETKPSAKPKRKTSINLETQIPESEIEDCPTLKAPQDLKADEKAAVEKIDPEKAKYIADRVEKHLAGTKSMKSFKMDGQYSEKYNKDNHSNISYKNMDDYDEKKYLKDNHSTQSAKTKIRRKSNNFNYESEVLKQASLKLEQYLKDREDDNDEEKIKLLINSPMDDNVFDEMDKRTDEQEEKLTFCQKVTIFFDLDLLQDFTFVNLMLGITLANFNELNFSILTPFILGDYGLSKTQIAFFMSLLAGVDICVRFCIPFVAGKIGWDNSSFFLFGVMTMAMGRVVLSFCQDYKVVLLVAVMIGFGKGLRTVFMALVIPSHVPLHKLPGASGLLLVTAGIAYLILGPIVATQGTLVIILNHGLGMLLSFFGGPVLQRFGYRKVAVVGGLLVSMGLLLTSVSNSFWLFILSYTMGVAAVMAAFSLAINSYFKEKRGRAIGAGMSITGLGAIYMPLVMSMLIYAYGWRYAVLILGAICLHSVLAACLLRPVKWYLKDPPQLTEEAEPLNKETSVELVNGSLSTPLKQTAIQSLSRLEQMDNKETQDIVINTNGIHNRNAVSHPDIRKNTPEPALVESRYKWWESQEINLGSSVNIFLEKDDFKDTEDKSITRNEKKSYTQKVIKFFDLTLLRDPIFVNILVGLSFASCVETNFSLLLPIILKDMLKFETSEIAKVMAVIGFSDTLFRFVSPFIGEWCNKPPRVMYILSLVIIIFTRTIMLFTTSFLGMVFVALAMGITKGVRTVYMNIVIPSYVPLERLPFASGIQMFFNGIVIITIGSLLGRIRDISGSYKAPIMVLNFVTLLTIILWSAEFLYFKFNLTKTRSTNENASN
ncbi:unnamed protein product [Leptidea sinapis]|nr:unnamed protein product [Leptidea sinapis]